MEAGPGKLQLQIGMATLTVIMSLSISYQECQGMMIRLRRNKNEVQGLQTSDALGYLLDMRMRKRVPRRLRVGVMSKITYWKCVDCGSMINDSNMHERFSKKTVKYAEFCYRCMQYNPEVVLAYD